MHGFIEKIAAVTTPASDSRDYNKRERLSEFSDNLSEKLGQHRKSAALLYNILLLLIAEISA